MTNTIKRTLIITAVAALPAIGFVAGQAMAYQPHMQNALTALENAKDSLEKATTDKGGHRNKALDYVKDAIKEVKKGMEAAR